MHAKPAMFRLGQRTKSDAIGPRYRAGLSDNNVVFRKTMLPRAENRLSGVFHIGLGDEFDADKLSAYPPGTVIVVPGGTSHFHWAKSSEYIAQVTAIGPLGLEYIHSKDDPRSGTS